MVSRSLITHQLSLDSLIIGIIQLTRIIDRQTICLPNQIRHGKFCQYNDWKLQDEFSDMVWFVVEHLTSIIRNPYRVAELVRIQETDGWVFGMPHNICHYYELRSDCSKHMLMVSD